MQPRSLTALLLLVACVAGVDNASAQRYPEKPIRFIVAAAAGSYPDLLARLVGQKMSENMGQPLVIDNRPGAGTNVGTAVAAKSAPDGYTLLLHSVSIPINATLYAKLDYDPQKDFTPVTQLTSVSNVVAVNAKLPVNSLAALIDYSKAKPGTVHFASGGNGTTAHLAGQLLKSMAGADIAHVPYANFNQGITDVISGQVAMVIPNLPPVLPHIKSGSLRALAVTGARRAAMLPDVPTVAEAGVPGFEVSSWHGIVVPAGTPAPIITRLHAEATKALKDPEVARKLAEMGAEAVGSSPQEYASYIQSETVKWARVVKEAGARVD